MYGPRGKSIVRQYVEAFGIASLLALVTRTFVLQAFLIPSASMLPTLQAGDHVLISKLSFGIRQPFVGGWFWRYHDPVPGDVIVFAAPVPGAPDFVKRVVAVGGETVEVRDKHLIVDGQPRDFPGAFSADGPDGSDLAQRRRNFGPVQVPRGQVFVLGDNRDNSNDSREWGFVDLAQVEGRVLVIYWSWDGRDRSVHWGRIGKLIK